jgi:hypothetical protein
MIINKGTCMLLDDAIPGDRNVMTREAETILKYKGLVTEIQGMWNVNAKVIPVTRRVNETISKSRTTIPQQHTKNAQN